MVDRVLWQGRLKIRRIPNDWTLDDFKYWWEPRLVDPQTGIVRIPSRMSEEEKDGLTVFATENTLLNNGITNILNYVSSGGASPGVMFQYFALGNGAIATINPSAPGLAGEYYRQAVTSRANFGTEVVLGTVIPSGSGNGTVTNAGHWGLTANAGLGTGTLMNQFLYLPAFVINNVQYTFDYTINILSN